jgi:hypothetical protein
MCLSDNWFYFVLHEAVCSSGGGFIVLIDELHVILHIYCGFDVDLTCSCDFKKGDVSQYAHLNTNVDF